MWQPPGTPGVRLNQVDSESKRSQLDRMVDRMRVICLSLAVDHTTTLADRRTAAAEALASAPPADLYVLPELWGVAAVAN